MYYAEIIWDLDDNPDGYVNHLAEHDISKDEFEEIFRDPESEATSHSSGRPMAFGWTSTGRYLAIVWEEIAEDPRMIQPFTAYETNPPARRRGRR